jgi:hypothetical protein
MYRSGNLSLTTKVSRSMTKTGQVFNLTILTGHDSRAFPNVRLVKETLLAGGALNALCSSLFIVHRQVSSMSLSRSSHTIVMHLFSLLHSDSPPDCLCHSEPRRGTTFYFPLHTHWSDMCISPGKTVHGGLILSLTDTLGSLVVASQGKWMTGVSTDIGASFVRPAGKTGDILHAKAVLTAMGESPLQD